ncbi:hypothetical protein N657DRAFT_652829 [Parathielavia appendiculata]|uniref:Uncharacterized protein n=1 Tax=Parathielavia appendiculata TaxID=2587402 RepID=A0AAN6UB20_9PEZI|nr:hypothetical protein N657DRAFT_652829 [Parathielavia appendiculata]
MNRTAPDWEADSWYKDSRQPPLATRLDTVVKFLAEEDDDRHQLDHASTQTQAMFNDALNKAKAHVLSTRLNWMIDGQDWPLPSRSTSLPDRRNLLPMLIPPRPPRPVHRMLVHRPGDDLLYEKFARDERVWWQRMAGDDLHHIPTDAENRLERNNMVYIEDQIFHSFAHGDSTGWIRTDPGTRQTSLPDGAPIWPGCPKSRAMERGARGAGLQQALRALPTNPTTDELHTPWRRLVLPVPTPPSLDRSQLLEHLDPMQCTVDYRERLRKIKMTRKLALMQVEAQHVGDPRWPALPPNLVNGGPFARRVLDSTTEARRDMLSQPLLEAVFNMMRAGAKGDSRAPEGVELANHEWKKAGRERRPRYLNHEELRWLKFLTGECVNSKNWTRRFCSGYTQRQIPAVPYLCPQGLLDDPNPEGLFSHHDAKVEVEDLLAAINAGKDSSIVTKYEFQPHDACCWLDRLNKSGHVRFRLDVMCCGVVERPVAEYFPEHRVMWPTTGHFERPKYLEKHITDFERVIQVHQPDISEGSAIWKFFVSLAFRLGYTISALEQAQAEEPAASQTATTRGLRDAITKWKQACANLQGTSSPEPTPQELATIRTRIIDELSANEPMLHPARTQHSLSRASGTPQTTLVRDHNWDWAALPVRGQSKRRQYWSVNRWPLGTGHLSEPAERTVRHDEHLDPAAQDPTTDMKYLPPKLTSYRQEKTVYRPGPAVFGLGDTRLQRERIEKRMAEMVEQALELERRPKKRIWGNTFASLNPFSRPSSRAEDLREDDMLPPVDPKMVPKSWDPVIEAEQQDADKEMESDAGSEEEIGDESDVQSVDVAMIGTSES